MKTTHTPTEHELKCWPEFFRALLSGAKTFELRRDDRGFRAWDVLWLREWRRLRIVDGRDEGEYTGREMRRVVTYVLSGSGLASGFVCLGLGPPSSAARQFRPYRLPDGRIVQIDASAAKDVRVITFTLTGGDIVDAIAVDDDDPPEDDGFDPGPQTRRRTA
jgi:hypothetical protein